MGARPAEGFALADLTESTGLEDAASFVVDLLGHPASDIRVVDGQLGLDEDLVLEGHPDDFELSPLSPVDPGRVWAVDGGSCFLADGRSFQVVGYRAARVRFAGGATDLVESSPLQVRALSPAEMETVDRDALAELCGSPPERLPE